jgi:hypothetical protein
MTTVTRFDVFTRAANEEEGLDEREVVRLFEKRKLVGEFETDDIMFDEWEDKLKSFLTETKGGDALKVARTLEATMDFLSRDADEEDEDEERESGSVVPEKYRLLYGAAQNCGDTVAQVLTDYVTEPRKNKKNPDGGLDRAKLRGVAEVNGISDKLANWEDRGLNGGLLRMNTSNVLRGMVRRGERVQIGDQVWEAREVEKKPRKKKAKAEAAATPAA